MQNVKGMFLSWIVVKDIEKAIHFYTKVLGLNLLEYHEEFKWAELSGPEGSRLGIAQESPEMDEKSGSNAIVTVTVNDIVKANEELVSKGAKLLGPIMEVPGHVKLQSLVDVDGNRLQLAQSLD